MQKLHQSVVGVETISQIIVSISPNEFEDGIQRQTPNFVFIVFRLICRFWRIVQVLISWRNLYFLLHACQVVHNNTEVIHKRFCSCNKRYVQRAGVANWKLLCEMAVLCFSRNWHSKILAQWRVFTTKPTITLHFIKIARKCSVEWVTGEQKSGRVAAIFFRVGCYFILGNFLYSFVGRPVFIFRRAWHGLIVKKRPKDACPAAGSW